MTNRVGQQLGHYRLLRVLGRGAFAEVYLGEHLYLERLAAIKVLHVQVEPQAQEQFRREARTIAHLQHPHIVQVLDFGLDDQTPYLVMEYTPGGTLRSRHPKGTRLPFEQIVTYVKQIASALDYAHQQHVIHRDVKPENLLLNAQHQIVLSDFGIAVVQQTLGPLSTQQPAGTPLYMAPEQIQGKPCPASDQYALAVLVYEWLCGEPPFRGSLFEVYSQHLSQPPPGLCECVPPLPSLVEDAVLGALAKDPQQRFSSVQDFAAVLEEACAATQPLVSPALAEGETWVQPALPVEPSTPIAATTTREGDLPGEMTQPRLTPAQRTGDEQEPVRRLTSLPAAVQSPTVSRQTRPSVAQSNRPRFLRRVRAFWIEGVLEHSLHGAALIALGLQEQLDALANPWHLVLQHPDTLPRSFPLDTRITEVYDAANGELLILGAPGSGKTTLLLELARDLLDRAEHDEGHLLPVIFPLSTWAAQQRPLAEWMVAELISKYQVPPKVARAWVDTHQILPLLDGLDEVETTSRTACIESINTYHQEHGFLPLVIASRSADYLAQRERLRLTSAVTIQSLTEQQVDDYLARREESLWALRVVLHQDAALRELTETPLMLSILTLTYHDMPVEELLRGGLAPTRQQVFERYVQRMFSRRGVSRRASQEQTLRWLTFLAKRMQQQNQTEFYLEHLQPDWLPDRGRRLLYRLSLGLLFGLVGWPIIGPIIELVLGQVGGPRIGQVGALVGGLIGALVLGLVLGRGNIHPEEVLTWSWRKARSEMVGGLLSGLVLGLLFGLGFGLGGALLFGLGFGLLVGLVSGLVRGFSTNQLDERMRFTPNQGIWHSARNGLLGGLLSGLGFGLIGGLLFGFVTRQNGGLLVGLVSGLSFGLIGGLVGGLGFGLRPFLQHFTLRFWLWRADCLPWNVVALLNEASERILLRKVGAGYIFVHRLLLEYFASLGTTPMLNAARAKRNRQNQPHDGYKQA